MWVGNKPIFKAGYYTGRVFLQLPFYWYLHSTKLTICVWLTMLPWDLYSHLAALAMVIHRSTLQLELWNPRLISNH